MPKLEIDEEEARRLATLDNAVRTIWANPEARKLVQQAQKLVDPKARTPDLDQEQAVLKPVSELSKKVDDFIEAQKAAAAEAAKNTKLGELKRLRDDGFAELRRQKYTDKGLEAIEKLMDEKGILDPLDAAAIFDKSNPPMAVMTPGGSSAWNFTALPAEGADNLKKLIETKGNNDLISEAMAWDAINEVRGASRR